MAVRAEIPPLHTGQLRRVGAAVQNLHERMCPEINSMGRGLRR
jgi:hypothetical protein